MLIVQTTAKGVMRCAPLAIFMIVSSTMAANADDAVVRGQALAQKLCSGCHAIGTKGASKLSNAPPIRDLAIRWKGEQLAEALAEGITTGHGAMPEFRLTPQEIGAFTAYFDDLGAKVRQSKSKQ